MTTVSDTSESPDQQPSERSPRGLELDLSEREREYSPSSRLDDGDFSPFIAAYADRSETARRQHEVTTITYGSAPSNTVDLLTPHPASNPGAPVDGLRPIHVFIHGGYWQQLSKHESLFSARDFLNQGIALAAVDYTLAPEATLDQIVDECCAAIEAVRLAAPDHGLDPDAMTISGSSAGAHLAAMATLRLPAEARPRSLILLSGVYLLEPLIGTTINEAVGLDETSARSLSPLLHDLEGFPPSVVAYGDNETDEFKRQSRALVDALTEAGIAVSEVEVPDRNHFDVVFDLNPRLTDILDLLAG